MDNCFQCGEPIETVEDFSIEHKVPWLDSEDPVKMFFDLTNVAFSHISCNVKAARRSKAPCGTVTCYKNGCRCDLCRKAKANSRFYCPERRKQQYHKHGT